MAVKGGLRRMRDHYCFHACAVANFHLAAAGIFGLTGSRSMGFHELADHERRHTWAGRLLPIGVKIWPAFGSRCLAEHESIDSEGVADALLGAGGSAAWSLPGRT